MQFQTAWESLWRPERTVERTRSGEKRLHALLEDYGTETVKEAFTELKQRAEQLMRANIKELPDGTLSCDDFLITMVLSMNPSESDSTSKFQEMK